MKANVDQETCIGCGLCTSVCPEVFEMNDNGKAQVKLQEVPTANGDEAKDAEASCPVNAISVS